ncbi:uncharacterized protein A4U43_C07F17410 [Asparagus officinalis]|uniref:HSF-type DNA-binding domain-containing protein n=1 Tax=Asparagus officinalis TaxID=4686 RepID=A0A5P1ECN3_ASPOF|nr:heat stress transcription factor B-4b-like [Asparagus officinalis]ONK63645.1 uncharacterized protein A4U43_C07F17410 [Asparagus officinalis]
MSFLVESCREMLLPMESNKSVPAPFLIKTYQLVDDPCTDHIVSWGEDDSTFVVWRPPEFSRDILPNYFKHNNFSSFVRQLNTYGFRKIVADRWEFANDFFRKGEKHLLSEIHRRKTSQIPQQYFYQQQPPTLYNAHQDEISTNWIDSPLPSPNSTDSTSEFISALSEDNQRLRRRNSLLLSELTHMKKLYNDIIYFLQNHVSPVQLDNQRVANFSNGTSLKLMEESHDQNAVKLFGVPLHGKKRLHHECESLE